MGLFIPGKRSQNRRFSYEPRYYDPQKDESVRRRLRIMTRSRRRRRPAAGAIYLAALLILALYIYSQL
ncbi:MAG: hypothetical protein R3178_10795 [Rhodothermales bacterium]|nr:hypothetical protein [Rhodothermales bacterium]